ncbi:MAG: transketolase [Candidatus Woesearchaeota archaeon]
MKRELQEIANILRRDVIKMTTAAESGHPTSCMSCAEIISALFFNEMRYNKDPFNPDNDEFILSKGHAAPILYAALHRAGRLKEKLTNLRKLTSSLEGHPTPELKWIKVATGSLGQGLSAGVGMALAAKLQKRKFRTYVLIGDSESAEGSNFEAIQLAAHYKLNNLCAILDVNRLGQTKQTMLGHNVEEYKKRYDAFGWNSIIIDGHDIEQILKALKKARESNKPTIIIAKTFKGKGIRFLENEIGHHGEALDHKKMLMALKELPNPKFPYIKIQKPTKTKFKIKLKKPNNINYKLGEEIATREAYGNALASLAERNQNILAIDAEVSNSTFSEEVKEKTPKQFIEAYIAEQNMIGMALGLSKKDFNVFASSFSAFLSRAHDQLRMAAVSDANFTVCGSHSGVSIGKDGASQMGLEDISMFRSLPNSIIFYPSDAVSTEKLTKLCAKLKGIKYIRTTRPKTPVIYKNSENFKIGDFKVLKKSKKDKAVVVGSGITVHEALKAYKELKNIAVIDLYCIKPFNSKKFIKFIKKHGNKVIIAEDHYKEGGIGEMLISELKNTNIKIKHLYIPEIPHSGTQEQLLNKYKINSKAIIKAVK